MAEIAIFIIVEIERFVPNDDAANETKVVRLFNYIELERKLKKISNKNYCEAE